MRAAFRRLTHDEGGQSIVIFVFLATALFATAALVINVGHFLQARQLAQGTADAAALAAVQEDPRIIFQGIDAASEYAGYNWPGSSVTDYHEAGRYPGNPSNLRTSEDVSVTIQKNVPALFGGFLDSIGVTFLNLDVKAFAAARSEPVLTLNQISPIALFCDDACMAKLATLEYPWPVDGSASFTFDFEVGNPTTSGFSPIELPGVTIGNFATYMSCNPALTASGSCNQADAEASNLAATSCAGSSSPPCWYDRLKLDPDNHTNADLVKSALDAAGAWPHLVAIYDSFDGGPAIVVPKYHIIGWAAFQFETSADYDVNGRIATIHLTGSFHKLFVGASRLSVDGFGGSLNDFGVRAVGLSQ